MYRQVAEGHFKGPGCFFSRADLEMMSAILEFYPACSPHLSIKGWDALLGPIESIVHTGDNFRAIFPPRPKGRKGDP